MDWDKILQLITTLAPLIVDCFKKQGRERTRQTLRRMGPLETIRLRRTLRKLDESDDTAREIRQRLQEATDDELDEIIDEAHEVAGLAAPTE
jgi:hypothetical protein